MSEPNQDNLLRQQMDTLGSLTRMLDAFSEQKINSVLQAYRENLVPLTN